jgi:E3 ubiquitin-protein ligase HUWE1
LKVLIDKENAVIVGTAVDELIRHHPSLKTSVFSSLRSTLTRIEELGMEYAPPDDIKHWYNLVPISGVKTVDVDVPMAVEASSETAETASSTNAPAIEASDDDEFINKTHDNIIVSYIDVVGRVRFQFRCRILFR